MNSSELLEAFRLDVEDLSDPPLWSDLEIYRYLNDACFQFVRMTGGIADFTSEACEVGITAGEDMSLLHPSIMRVMSAKRRSDNREIEVVNITDLHAHYRSDYGVRVKQFLDDTPGPVRMMVLGMQRDLVRWVQVPEFDDAVDMVIYRLPLKPITGAGQALDDVEEIHHLHLLDWMKHLAYKKQDAETFSPKDSERSGQAFLAYCDQVRAEWERYKHKTRVVAYGGI